MFSSPPQKEIKDSDSMDTSSSNSDINSSGVIELPTPSTSTELPPKRSVSEIIDDNFTPFDRQSELVIPFHDEVDRDAEAREKLREMLFDLLIDCYAWSNARPKAEVDRLAKTLQKEATSVMEIEQEQERTRARLSEFVSSIQTALKALVGVIF